MTPIQKLFDKGADQYDGLRRKVIYCFDDFYGTLLELIPFAPEDTFAFTDLGAGTGLVSALVTANFPRAKGTLIDLSPRMLAKARERFDGNPHVTFQVCDYAKENLPGHQDLILSALSIHHLSDGEKELLMAKLFQTLKPGGCFIHAELVRGTTPATEDRYQARWRGHLSQADIAADELQRIYERMTLDQTAGLEYQMAWMRTSGFTDVDCYFKHHNFAVYAGRRPSSR